MAVVEYWPSWLWPVPWLGLVAFMSAAVAVQRQGRGRAGPDVPIGWPNRFLVLTYGAWIAVAAWTALRG
jgi:hypothetical protein